MKKDETLFFLQISMSINWIINCQLISLPNTSAVKLIMLKQ